jgi:hypothetical protein
MKNSLFKILLFVFFVSCGQNKSSLEKDWTRIFIKDFGSFDLPPTMEIQDGLAKKMTEKYDLIMELPASNVIAQQKGLNKDMTIRGAKGKGGERYARIILTTVFGDAWTTLYCKESPFSKYDLISANNEVKKQFAANLKSNNFRIVEWFPLKFVKLNNMCSLHISYVRSGHKSDVKVDEYQIFNNDRTHQLILSYRLNEKSIWDADFKKLLNSIKITNVR